ncbi:MAG: insulinase family protein [Candidatus Accumulibacter sp.]|jgi:zinc protease|nr:insulinase family protein [Accumulibacter sp.]
MNAMKMIPCPRALGALLLAVSCNVAVAGPVIEHWVAPSGARVYFVENHALPMLDLRVDFPAGSASDPAGKPGLASLTHVLLDLGAEGMDENAIANRLADLGAQVSGGVDRDRASVSLRTLSARETRDAALDVFRTMLCAPVFPADVFEREKARNVAALKESLTRPDTIVSRAFWAALYPDHAYGRSATPASIEAISRDELERFYREHYGAGGASLTIVGDIGRNEAEALAQKLTEKLPVAAGASPSGVAPGLPAGGEQRIAHPAAQAHVLIGLPALKRGDPDFFALQVGNYTLGGGGFVSRLMREVRDKRGFAYSVYSGFVPLMQPGPFLIGLQTRKEQADEALRVTRETLARFLAEGPAEAELQAAKQYLSGSFPLRLDSNGELVDNVAAIGFYGLPLDYLDTYMDKVEEVTATEVRAAFARRIRRENLVTVVVGGTDR